MGHGILDFRFRISDLGMRIWDCGMRNGERGSNGRDERDGRSGEMGNVERGKGNSDCGLRISEFGMRNTCRSPLNVKHLPQLAPKPSPRPFANRLHTQTLGKPAKPANTVIVEPRMRFQARR